MSTPRSLIELIDRIDPGSGDEPVSVEDVMHRIGEDSFAPVVLVPALLLVSPLSGIPGTPTIGALLIITITLQWVLVRRHLWLPGVLMRRSVSAARLSTAVGYLRRPAAWFDRHTKRRFVVLAWPPLSLIPKLTIICVAASWPLLELLPFVTSFGAGAVSLLAFGMMMRDGVYIVAGYVTVGSVVALIGWLTTAV